MHQIQQYLLANIPKAPHNVVKLAMEQFNVTRAAILFHLNKLKATGLIIQHGTRNKVSYEVRGQVKEPHGLEKEFFYKLNEKCDEDEIWKKDIKPLLTGAPKNVMDICQYGFTEMFNNVIDHSKSKTALVVVNKTEDHIELMVNDLGIGVFKNIAEFFGIKDLREAVVKLHQGKVTTDESRHSGQGIFFTSRVFDKFVLTANGFLYLKDNSKVDDWYWERQDEANEIGTHVRLTVSLNSKRVIKDVFDEYTNEDSFKFERSHIRIELGKFEEDSFVSRSQAKRLLAGLTDFGTITLDFKNIRNVGQAFVDEVFGVFGLANPQIFFLIINANEDVQFMIKRGLAERQFPLERIKMTSGTV